MTEQLEAERAGKPYGMERIHAAHLERLLLERRHADAADRAAVGLRLRRGDLDVDRHFPPVGHAREDVELYHAIGEPS